MTAQELEIVRAVLVENKLVEPTATVGEITSAHEAVLKSEQAPAYKAQLEAQGVRVGPNWLTILGLVGGGIALYLIWSNSQKPRQVSAHEYPEPEDVGPRIRRMGKAMGSLRGGSHFRGQRALGRHTGQGPSIKYEFEPELRLDGYRRKRSAR
jgi:hypothetical protein